MNRVVFTDSSCEGKGLIANIDLPKGTEIHVTHAWSEAVNDWINLKPNCSYNHSKVNENCIVKTTSKPKYKILIALRDITQGEELFVDYTKDTDLEQPQEGWKE